MSTVINPMRVNNPSLSGKIEDELDEQTALPFPRWNPRQIIIDPVMIIYWLKCIFKPNCRKLKKYILYVWSPCMKLMEELH